MSSVFGVWQQLHLQYFPNSDIYFFKIFKYYLWFHGTKKPPSLLGRMLTSWYHLAYFLILDYHVINGNAYSKKSFAYRTKLQSGKLYHSFENILTYRKLFINSTHYFEL